MNMSERLKEVYPQLSPGKRLVADYINDHLDIVAYCTASELAKSAGVSNAQIVKFVKTLGFESYKDLQTTIRGEVTQHISISGSLRNWRASEQGDMRDNCWNIINQDRENIRLTFANIDFQCLEEIADRIAAAKRVGFVAARSGAACNLVSCISIGEMRENVFHFTPGFNNTTDALKWWGPEDILIGVSAYSYGKGFATDMLNYARERGCYTVWFTDSETFMQTPVMPYDQVVQYATRSAMISFNSLVAIYNVIDYLVATRLNDSTESISRTEELLFPDSLMASPHS